MTETPWEGRFLKVQVEGRWEYVARARDIHAAVIVAIDDANRVVLVEQWRVPLGQRSLELPAGLVGDDDAGEAVEAAAARELEEETGFRADRVEAVGEFASSPGLTSERFTLVRAHGLTRTGPGGGTAGEDIAVHLVPLAGLAALVAAKRADGVSIDAKLLLLLAPALI